MQCDIPLNGIGYHYYRKMFDSCDDERDSFIQLKILYSNTIENIPLLSNMSLQEKGACKIPLLNL